MIPWVRLATATAPDGVELKLMRRGEEFSITAAGAELMNSRRGASEVALGRIACEPLRGAPTPQVLIGGLGMGFTLRAALDVLGRDAMVKVAELVPEVIDWARGDLAGVFLGSLDDARVRVAEADVADVIVSARAAYDAILLDVDNGPGGLVQSANDRLYDARGLAAALGALKPGGVLAVWSSARDRGFSRRLAAAGFAVQEHEARSGPSRRGARHLIWIAKAPSAREM